MPNLSLRISNDPRSVGYGYCPSSKLLVFSLGEVWGGGGGYCYNYMGYIGMCRWEGYGF